MCPQEVCGYRDDTGPQSFLTSLALEESYHRRRYVYGRWDRIFGAWVWEGGAVQEFTPTWAWLEVPGTFFDRPSDWRRPKEDASWTRDEWDWMISFYQEALKEPGWCGEDPCDYEVSDRANIQDFNCLIPEETRALAATFGPFQWLALEAIWDEPAFARYLEPELARCGPRHVASVWQLSRAASMPRRTRRALNRAIIDEPKRALLSRFMPHAATARFLKCLHRVDDCTNSLTQIDALAAVIGEDRRRQVLAYWRGPYSRRLLDLLQELPSWLADHRVVLTIVRDKDLADQLGAILREADFLSRAMDPIEAAQFQQGIRERMRRTSALRTLERFHEGLIQKKLKQTPYPTPPCQGTALLKPISSYDELENEGRRMSNCSWQYLHEVLKGDVYFYHWGGAEEATVALALGAEGTWRIFDIRIADDVVPPLSLVRQITADLDAHILVTHDQK